MAKSYRYIFRDREGNEDEGLIYAKNSKSALLRLISDSKIEEIIELVDNEEIDENMDENSYEVTIEFLQSCVGTFKTLSELRVDGSINSDIEALECALEVLERRCG